jgi:hypothetical protein
MSNFSPGRGVFIFLLISTGIFAMVGSYFTWGAGYLFEPPFPPHFPMLAADLIVTGPTSLLAAFALWKRVDWAPSIGYFVAGIYIFGAVQVFFLVFLHGPPYPMRLIVPAIFGMGIAFSLIGWLRLVLEIKD